MKMTEEQEQTTGRSSSTRSPIKTTTSGNKTNSTSNNRRRKQQQHASNRYMLIRNLPKDLKSITQKDVSDWLMRCYNDRFLSEQNKDKENNGRNNLKYFPRVRGISHIIRKNRRGVGTVKRVGQEHDEDDEQKEHQQEKEQDQSDADADADAEGKEKEMEDMKKGGNQDDEGKEEGKEDKQKVENEHDNSNQEHDSDKENDGNNENHDHPTAKTTDAEETVTDNINNTEAVSSSILSDCTSGGYLIEFMSVQERDLVLRWYDDDNKAKTNGGRGTSSSIIFDVQLQIERCQSEMFTKSILGYPEEESTLEGGEGELGEETKKNGSLLERCVLIRGNTFPNGSKSSKINNDKSRSNSDSFVLNELSPDLVKQICATGRLCEPIVKMAMMKVPKMALRRGRVGGIVVEFESKKSVCRLLSFSSAKEENSKDEKDEGNKREEKEDEASTDGGEEKKEERETTAAAAHTVTLPIPVRLESVISERFALAHIQNYGKKTSVDVSSAVSNKKTNNNTTTTAVGEEATSTTENNNNNNARSSKKNDTTTSKSDKVDESDAAAASTKDDAVIKSLESRIDKLLKKQERYTKDREGWKKSKIEWDNVRSKLNKQVQELTKQKNVAEETTKDLRDNIVALKADQSKNEESIIEVEPTKNEKLLKDLKDENVKLEEQIADLKEQMKSEKAKHETQLAEVQQRLTETTERLQSRPPPTDDTNVSLLQKELKDTQDKYEKSQSEVTQLKERMAESTTTRHTPLSSSDPTPRVGCATSSWSPAGPALMQQQQQPSISHLNWLGGGHDDETGNNTNNNNSILSKHSSASSVVSRLSGSSVVAGQGQTQITGLVNFDSFTGPLANFCGSSNIPSNINNDNTEGTSRLLCGKYGGGSSSNINGGENNNAVAGTVVGEEEEEDQTLSILKNNSNSAQDVQQEESSNKIIPQQEINDDEETIQKRKEEWNAVESMYTSDGISRSEDGKTIRRRIHFPIDGSTDNESSGGDGDGDGDANNAATIKTAAVPVELIVTVPNGYPTRSDSILTIDATILSPTLSPGEGGGGDSSSSQKNEEHNKIVLDALPQFTQECTRIAGLHKGEESLIAVMTRAESWMRTEWKDLLQKQK